MRGLSTAEVQALRSEAAGVSIVEFTDEDPFWGPVYEWLLQRKCLDYYERGREPCPGDEEHEFVIFTWRITSLGRLALVCAAVAT